jgi:hypothetical protein
MAERIEDLTAWTEDLEEQVDAMDRAMTLMVEALERMDARIGEWAVDWPTLYDQERDDA